MLALAEQDQMEAVGTCAAIQGEREQVATLQEKLDTHMGSVWALIEKVKHIQTEARGLKRDVNLCTLELEKMWYKMTSLEDQDRHNNVMVTGIATDREGGDATAFPQEILPKWIPSFCTTSIQMEIAHRISNQNAKDNPQTMVFKVQTPRLFYKERVKQDRMPPSKMPGETYVAGQTLFSDLSRHPVTYFQQWAALHLGKRGRNFRKVCPATGLHPPWNGNNWEVKMKQTFIWRHNFCFGQELLVPAPQKIVGRFLSRLEMRLNISSLAELEAGSTGWLLDFII